MDGLVQYVAPENPGVSSEGFRVVICNPTQLRRFEEHGHRGLVMDDTFSVTMYDLRLTTVLVLDDYDRAFPCGFILSSQMREEDIAQFFLYVR